MAKTQPSTARAPLGRQLWQAMHPVVPADTEFDERELAILGQAGRQADGSPP